MLGNQDTLSLSQVARRNRILDAAMSLAADGGYKRRADARRRRPSAPRWGYTFTLSAGGATVEESWAVVRLHPMVEELPEERLLGLIDQSCEGIADTLANFKRVAEAS